MGKRGNVDKGKERVQLDAEDSSSKAQTTSKTQIFAELTCGNLPPDNRWMLEEMESLAEQPASRGDSTQEREQEFECKAHCFYFIVLCTILRSKIIPIFTIY